jgi:hypothetical protein
MIDGDKFALVLKHHNLIFRIPTDLRIFPIIYRNLRRFRTIVARDMEDAASWDKVLAARSLLADMRGVVNVRI